MRFLLLMSFGIYVWNNYYSRKIFKKCIHSWILHFINVIKCVWEVYSYVIVRDSCIYSQRYIAIILWKYIFFSKWSFVSLTFSLDQNFSRMIVNFLSLGIFHMDTCEGTHGCKGVSLMRCNYSALLDAPCGSAVRVILKLSRTPRLLE